jgi:carboxyl-terminal processing protease
MYRSMLRSPIHNLALCAALACSTAPDASLEKPDEGTSPAPESSSVQSQQALSAAPDAAPTAAPSRSPSPSRVAPATVMPDSERAFAQVVELISSDYMAADIDREALYTGAIEGMLARLYQAKDTPVNTLLSPRELRQIQSSNTGSIGGVGIAMEPEGGVFVIRRILDNTPAQRSRLQPGDRILGVGAERVRDRPLDEVVDLIRGEPGTLVELFVQRDTEEWYERIERATVTLRNVEGRTVAPGIGLVRLLSFVETTPADLDRELDALAGDGQKALILDLRYCPGGLLDVGEAVVERFLERGQRVVTRVDRDGRRHVRTAAADGRWRRWPLAVLIGPRTASSAELFAEALAVHRGAVTIGQATLGKKSAETIHALDNGWALKLSDSRLIGARGDDAPGGLEPMLPVPLRDDDNPPPLDTPLSQDTALRVATEWLKSRS